MKMLVAKNRVLSAAVVVLILMSLIVAVAMAAPQPPLVLPTDPVSMTYVENDLDLDVPAYLTVTLELQWQL